MFKEFARTAKLQASRPCLKGRGALRGQVAGLEHKASQEAVRSGRQWLETNRVHAQATAGEELPGVFEGTPSLRWRFSCCRALFAVFQASQEALCSRGGSRPRETEGG